MKNIFKKELKLKGKTESKYITRMAGEDYINSTLAYLDYLEDHLHNVSQAFSELTDACDEKEYWSGDLLS